MTPAEIAHTARMLRVAQRALLVSLLRAHLYTKRNQQPPVNLQMSITDHERTIERLEAELSAVGVEVE